MIKGAVPSFVDGSFLSGDEFAWIQVLRELSNPEFRYPEEHPGRNIRTELAAVQLTYVVDAAIKTHRNSIRKLKDKERDCQAMAVSAMLADAFESGALELLSLGVERGKVTAEDEAYVRNGIAARRLKGWCLVASACADLLEKIQTNVLLKGTKSRPFTGSDINSIVALTDQQLLYDIQCRIPKYLDTRSEDYWTIMFNGIAPEVRRYLREGKLPTTTDELAGVDLQMVVDAHARRLRNRCRAIKDRFLAHPNEK